MPRIYLACLTLIVIASGCEQKETPAECERFGGMYSCTQDTNGLPCEDSEDPACSCECITRECSTDSECAQGKYCAVGRCFDSGCAADSDCPGDKVCVDAKCVEDTTVRCRFVLLEDVSNDSGDYPGADVDAIKVCRPDGLCTWAVTVEDVVNAAAATGPSNDPDAVLGPPDADCDYANDGAFYSMGGATSSVIVSFGSETIALTDEITVVQLGAGQCGGEDEPVAVGVGCSTDLGDFVEVSSCQDGACR